jgi:hypothetical protein
MIIGNCGRRVNNLIAKNTEETLLDFWLIAKKNTLILIELLSPCSLFWTEISGLLQKH